MKLTYRKLNGAPPSYRVSLDAVEIGSISLRTNHITNADYWHWGIDTMPLIAGRTPEGTPRASIARFWNSNWPSLNGSLECRRQSG